MGKDGDFVHRVWDAVGEQRVVGSVTQPVNCGKINSMKVYLTPSILAADLLKLGEQVSAAGQGGADRFQVDVMDGVFVPNISFGLPLIKAMRRATALPLEAHLMIVQPERYVDAFAQAGADTIIVHQETSPHLDRTVQRIKELGKRAGVALNPATPVAVLDEILPLLDQVLIMTVNPGFGGQRFIDYTLGKVQQLRQQIDRVNPACDLEVDGGIDEDTGPRAVKAGANVLVAGTLVFTHPHGPAAGVAALRHAIGLV